MTFRLSLLTISLLSGCSWVKPAPVIAPVEVVRVEIPAPIYQPVLPEKISAVQVEWKVLTPDYMNKYIHDLSNGEAPVNVWYALSTDGYKNISTNMAEIKRYIRQLLNVVYYYQDITTVEEDDDGTID